MSETSGSDPSQTQKMPQLSEIKPLQPLPEAEPQIQHTQESRISLHGLVRSIASRNQAEPQEQIQRAYNKKDHKKALKRDRKMGKTTRHANNIAVIEAVYGDGTAGSVNPDHIASPTQIMKPGEWGALRDRRIYKVGERKIADAQKDETEARRRERLANIPESEDHIKRLGDKGWGLSDQEREKQRQAPTKSEIEEAYWVNGLLHAETAPKKPRAGDPDAESRVEKVVSFATRVDTDLSKLTSAVLSKNQLTLNDFQYLVSRSNRKATLSDVAKAIERLESAGIIAETETPGTWKATITSEEYKLAEKYAFDVIRERQKKPDTTEPEPAKPEASSQEFVPRTGVTLEDIRRLNENVVDSVNETIDDTNKDRESKGNPKLNHDEVDEIRATAVHAVAGNYLNEKLPDAKQDNPRAFAQLLEELSEDMAGLRKLDIKTKQEAAGKKKTSKK